MIEGASYTLSVHPDPKLDAYVDSMIAKIAAAQEKDGYLYTTRTIDPQHPHPWAGANRWELEKVDSHELYNLGHLYEAAVAHYQATGKRTLLDIALRTADLLDAHVRPGQEVDLARTPDHRDGPRQAVPRRPATQQYLDLAKFMLDERGPDGDKGAGRTYNQSQAKIVEQTEAVGHAVRATYMYSGMADVAALTGDAAYMKTSDTIWDNLVAKKLYITGGIGATGRGEAFGGDYELPNMTAYNETCAADRQRLLEPPAVPAPRRREVHRRDGAHALQRPALGRVARRQVVLLPEPARVERPARAQPVVRRRLLPGQHHALPRVGPRLRLREAGRRRST